MARVAEHDAPCGRAALLSDLENKVDNTGTNIKKNTFKLADIMKKENQMKRTC